RPFPKLAENVIPRKLTTAALFELAADALGLIDRDEIMLDQQVAQAALVGIGRLLLLLPAELNFRPGRQTQLDDDFTDLSVDVRRKADIAVGVRHGSTILHYVRHHRRVIHFPTAAQKNRPFNE